MNYSEGLKFGYGVFETIAYSNVLEDFDLHMNRLQQALLSLKMSPVDENILYSEALSVLEKTKDNAIRISVYQDKDQFITYETRSTHQKKQYNVCFSEIKRHSSNPLLKIKSTAHLNYYLEKIEMTSKGYDEALHFNERDEVTEGIYTNLFFVKDQIVYTPDISCGLLEGIYRNRVIENLKKLGIPLKMGYYNKENIVSADEVFLTNSLIKIMPVFQIENNDYDSNNYITQQLMEEML